MTPRQAGASLPNVKQAVRDLSDNADDERGAQVRYEIDRRVKAGQQQQLAESCKRVSRPAATRMHELCASIVFVILPQAGD